MNGQEYLQNRNESQRNVRISDYTHMDVANINHPDNDRSHLEMVNKDQENKPAANPKKCCLVQWLINWNYNNRKKNF